MEALRLIREFNNLSDKHRKYTVMINERLDIHNKTFSVHSKFLIEIFHNLDMIMILLEKGFFSQQRICSGKLFDLSEVKPSMITKLKDAAILKKTNMTQLLPIPSTEFATCVFNEGSSLAFQYLYHFLDQYPLMAGYLAFYVTAFSLFTNVMIGAIFQHFVGHFV